MEVLRGLVRDKFRSRLRCHLLKSLPDYCEPYDSDELDELIARGERRAREHGFASDRAVCKFLNLWLVFGQDFDRRSGSDWVRDALAAGGSPEERIDVLYKSAIEHWQLARPQDTRQHSEGANESG